MAFIDPLYSIGIVEMDAQHARLIQIAHKTSGAALKRNLFATV